MNENALEGRTALITGAAVRVGAAIARCLHDAGANLLLHYRNSEQPALTLSQDLEAQRPHSVHLLQADLLDPGQIDTLIAQVADLSDGLDLLVNNASSYYPTPLATASAADWDDLFGTNARAPFVLAQSLAPMLRQRQGSIVNIVDVHAERPRKEYCLYSMAKAANAMMIKALARELAPEIRVNGVAPGAVLWPHDEPPTTDHRAILERIPLARPGTPEDVAEAVRYLATAPYVTGEIIRVDGGRSTQQ